MKKRAASRGRKQEGTPVAMSVAMQQLMLPLLLAMDATKKGLLAFVQQMGMVALSELLVKEAAMIAGPKGSTSRDARIITGARPPRPSASVAGTCRSPTRAFEPGARAEAKK